jgi:hypothetical protein
MKNKKNPLFAIYKNGNHLGNERGENIADAIKNYLVAALFEDSIDDIEFVSLYSGKVAIKNIHFL